MTPGGLYFIRVSAVNRAGATNTHDTDGVIYDATNPMVGEINITNFSSDSWMYKEIFFSTSKCFNSFMGIVSM